MRKGIHKLISIAILGILLPILGISQISLPEGFYREWLPMEFDGLVGLTFDAQDRMYAWERSGKVWLIENGIKAEEAFFDISHEVGNYSDSGFLGFVLDPDYEQNGYFYGFYLVDSYHLLYADEAFYNPEQDLYYRATITRCTRYTALNPSTNPEVDYDSRKVLFGQEEGLGSPAINVFHIGCGIDFGDDGTLLLSTGDGNGYEGPYLGDGPPYFGNFVVQALEDGILMPNEEVGQLVAQQKESLAGKVLRIDPETGEGVPSNPYYDPANPNSNASKVWSLGFRNPFKLKVRPGSGLQDPSLGLPGVIYLGDVGNGLWEELNVIKKGGLNFGWPLYEGCEKNIQFLENPQVNKFAKNPFAEAGSCDEYFAFKDLLKQESLNEINFPNPCDPTVEIPEEFQMIHTRPALNLAHITAGLGVFYGDYDEDGNAINLSINDPYSKIEGDLSDQRAQAVVGGDFYDGVTFPEEYHDRYFVGDYNQGWINAVEYDLNDEIKSVSPFYQDSFPIVHIESNPNDGCLYMVNYNYNRIGKICYGDDLPPVASFEMDKNFGPSPLIVDFNTNNTFDPNGETLNYLWSFGDGESSTDANPMHTFIANDGQAKSFTVNLKVTNESGLSAEHSELVSINNSPPKVEITSIADGQLYNMTGISVYDLKAAVSDDEHQDDELEYKWIWSLHHNTHNHPEPPITDHESSVELRPFGCEDEVYFYGLRLIVKDAAGLESEDEVFLYPDCGSKYVDLLDFKASLQDKNGFCIWQVENEDGVDSYAVERARIDRKFNTLGTINAVGSLYEEYEYIDEDILPGFNIYRLKMISADGDISYSNDQFVLNSDEEEIFVYPNPVSNELKIFYGQLHNLSTVEIFNNEGRVIRRHEVTGNGTQVVTIDVTGVHPGSYHYRIINKENIETGSFLIIRD